MHQPGNHHQTQIQSHTPLFASINTLEDVNYREGISDNDALIKNKIVKLLSTA